MLSFITCVLSNLLQRKSIWQLHLVLFAGVLWKQIPRSALPSTPALHRISVLRDYSVARSHRQVSHQTKDLCLFTTRGDNPVHSFLCGNHSLVDKLIKSVRAGVSQVNLKVSLVCHSAYKPPKTSRSQVVLFLLLSNTMKMLHMKI